MAYLYARYFCIDGGEHQIEDFHDENYMEETGGSPCIEMAHINGGIGFWQYAVSEDDVDDPSELNYYQSDINGQLLIGQDALAEAARTYFDNVADHLKEIAYYCVNETADVLSEIEASASEVFGEDSFHMEVETGVNHILAVDEDEIENFDLDKFHIIWVMYKRCEIDDSWVRLLPLEEFEPNAEYATVDEAMEAEAIDSFYGLDIEAMPKEYRDNPELIHDELCDEFLDDFEQFGYVTALK